jgi:hypothetical protein
MKIRGMRGSCGGVAHLLLDTTGSGNEGGLECGRGVFSDHVRTYFLNDVISELLGDFAVA